MLANLKIICQFHAHSVHQNSVEIDRGGLYFRAEIYRGRLLTLITGSSSRLLRIRFSAELTMYWFPVYHFRCMKFKTLVICIWDQNIAISTIVGTSFHITRKFKQRWWISDLPSFICNQWTHTHTHKIRNTLSQEKRRRKKTHNIWYWKYIWCGYSFISKS